MVDFFMISAKSVKRGTTEISPKFIVGKSKDLMIRGGDFYAVWLEDKGVWSQEEDDLIRLIDKETSDFAKKFSEKNDDVLSVKYMRDSDSGLIDKWHKFCQRQQRDNFHPLDEKLIFADDPVRKEDYASKRLTYSLENLPHDAYDALMTVLYDPQELRKIEWAIGSVINGDSVKIQKFLVLYGSQGTGKGTVLDIISKLFDGYWESFSAQVLGQAQNSFALEAFKSNPLVAIDYDGKLSRIEDNTRLNTLIAHEPMLVNNKFEKQYKMAFKSFLFIGTNEPVKITDAKSGILRRLIDVRPTGNIVPKSEYARLMKQIDFELGSIANHCLKVYLEDPDYYETYRPTEMMGETNDFYDFMMDYYLDFSKEDMTTLRIAWERYKTYIDEARVPFPLSQRAFKNELKNYFMDYKERGRLEDGSQAWNVYFGFRADKFVSHAPVRHTDSEKKLKIDFKEQPSKFDEFCFDCPAQYAKEDGTPKKAWDNVTTTLQDLDTSKLHYVRVPLNLVTVDFDLKDDDGNKSLERNIEAAALWPPTYAELSKSGAGIHLSYIYTGDVEKLENIYEKDIEIKVSLGKAALRRKLTKCNDLPITTISSGLPLKGDDKKLVDFEGFKNEENLKRAIIKQLAKSTHPSTKSSMDCIKWILDNTYEEGKISYDLTEMRPDIISFANQSTNQADYCLSLVTKLHLKSKDIEEGEYPGVDPLPEAPIVFYDVEVFPNLFVVCWKKIGKENKVVKMINPDADEIKKLCKFKLVGFNCRRYDNHILYARMQGYSLKQLYDISQKIVSSDKKENQKSCFFGGAYNLSYTDIWDYASNKQSLKKWEIQLGIHHQELGLPWDKPVPEELWQKVADYCVNDVNATEAVWNATQEDFKAREILADLTGGTVNMTTNNLILKLIFEDEKKPNLVYTDLATGEGTDGVTRKINAFPGYEYIPGPENKGKGRNMYRGVDLGFGGYVYAVPGMYKNVTLLDVANMHGASIENLNLFDKRTIRYANLRTIRNCIKHRDFDTPRQMFDGMLAKYLENEDEADKLSGAIKLPCNQTYGLTSATFDNLARDPRNVNNIVALRGALFMKTLQDEVTEKGYKVIHIKTDSIKIVDADDTIIKYCMKRAEDYGYLFEHECTYDRVCLINDSTYIAKYDDQGIRNKGGKHANEWVAVAKQFQVPYVFKSLFSKEEIEFSDMCETFSVKEGDIYLDMNEKLPDVTEFEKERKKLEDKYKKGQLSDTTFEKETIELDKKIAKGHDYVFVGRVGQFTPIKEGYGGGVLYRFKDGKKYAVQGTSGYRWLESEVVKQLGKEDDVDTDYYENLCTDAIAKINEFGSFDEFITGEFENPNPKITPAADDFMNIPEDVEGDEMPFD